MIQAPDPLWFPLINEFVRDTPRLHPIMMGYADHAIVVFAAPSLARWWIARRTGDPNVLAAATAFTRVESIRDVLAWPTPGTAIGGAGFWAARPVLYWLQTGAERSPLVRRLLTTAGPTSPVSR